VFCTFHLSYLPYRSDLSDLSDPSDRPEIPARPKEKQSTCGDALTKGRSRSCQYWQDLRFKLAPPSRDAISGLSGAILRR